jgi:hypothetical protein
MDDLNHWLPHSFFRPPSWRWRRASYLVEQHRRLNRHIDDEQVRAIRDYIVAQLTRPARPRPTGEHCAIHEAYQFRQNADAMTRCQLEAYLLTDLPFNEIAVRCHLPPPIVTAYAETFFDVRPHLGAQDWIGVQAIKCASGPQPCEVIKFAAYNNGPQLAELFIATARGAPLPAWVLDLFDGDRSYVEHSLRLRLRIDMAVLTAQNIHEARRLDQIRHRLDRLDHGRLARLRQAASMLPELESLIDAKIEQLERAGTITTKQSLAAERLKTIPAAALDQESLPGVRAC